MKVKKKTINVERLRGIFENDPQKKRDVCESLSFDRQTISKVLSRKRNIEGGELLTIAAACEIDPVELAV